MTVYKTNALIAPKPQNQLLLSNPIQGSNALYFFAFSGLPQPS